MRPSVDLRGPLIGAVERWLLPTECLLCHAPVDRVPDDPLICSLCRSLLKPLPYPVCARCGQPPTLPDLPCRLCPEWPDGFTRARSAVWLEGPAREAVHHLKYAGWWRVTEVMAEAMRGLEPLANSGVLVPIPLTQKRLRTRGYNQSERLARALADRRTAGPPVRIDLLRRGRETPTQTALTPEERRANVAGAFTVHASRLPDTVVLVDDVFTTGATLAEAAGACLAAGVKQVEAVTFARARPVIPS